MKIFIKILLIPVLFLVACILAGAYGALHNQISYSVSPEYFTKFKFHQFGMIHFQDRLGASFVGWAAAWWMGIVIGIILIPLGLIIQGASTYFWVMLRVFGIVVLTTLLVGLVALAAAHFFIDANAAGEISRYGNEIENDVAFARAGCMHNFSYLGGLLGILTGGAYIVRCRLRMKPQSSRHQDSQRERDITMC